MEKIMAYLPPDADKVQTIYESGKVGIQILEPGKKFKLTFPDYNQKGDALAISIDLAGKKLMSMSVNTYIDKPEDKVTFDIVYSSLPDGTQYASGTTLIADAKNLKLVIEQSGFRKANNQ